MKLDRVHLIDDTEDLIWIFRELEEKMDELKEENESLQTQIEEVYSEKADLQLYADWLEENLLEMRDDLKDKRQLLQELQARLAGLEK